MRRKASFTLLEMLLCVALVACAFSVLTISIPNFLGSERFEREARVVQEKLALAQELMIDCDTSVKLILDKGQLLVAPQKSLPKSWLRAPKRFKEIQTVLFDNQPVERLELIFDGEIAACPRGVLTLVGKKRRQRSFYLAGFPGRMDQKKEALCAQNAPYPQEFLSHS